MGGSMGGTGYYPGVMGPEGTGGGPGAGQLVQQRTEELSKAVREKWGQALGGLSLFGNRTKVLAETAASQIGESAQSAQKAIGETSTGIWGRLRSGVDQVKGSVFERNDPNQQGQGYPLSQFGVPPPQRGHYPPGYPPQQPGGPRGYPPPGYPPQHQQPGGPRGGMPPPGYPPQQPRAGGPPGFMPRPGYTPPYPPGIRTNPQQQGGAAPPIQSQWGGGIGGPPPVQQQQGQPPNVARLPVQGQQQPVQGQQQQGQQQGQPRPGPFGQFPQYDYPGQDPPLRQGPPLQQQQQQSQQQHTSGLQNPAEHPGWSQ